MQSLICKQCNSTLRWDGVSEIVRCDYCGKAYLVSVTDADLRKDIRRYRTLAEKHKIKPLSEQTLREMAALKEQNLKRAAKLRQIYILEG